MHLDLLDRKILAELDKDSRQGFSKLANKLGKSQQMIDYRVKRMVDDGVITSFTATFSTLAIGLPLIVKVYFQLRGLTHDRETKIYDFLLKHEDTNWVAKTLGMYDIFAAVMVKDMDSFARFKEKFFEMFGENINNYEISFMSRAYTFPRNYLIEKKSTISLPAKMHQQVKLKIQEHDKEIMRRLSENSRINILELSKVTGMSSKTITKKLRDYRKAGIIQGYRINLDRKKIGHVYFKVFIKLKDYNPTYVRKLKSFCLAQDYLIHFIENIGKYEFELEMEMPSSEKMQELVKKLRNEHSIAIESIETVEIIKELKLSWLPGSF